jgi:hypothetical protein
VGKGASSRDSVEMPSYSPLRWCNDFKLLGEWIADCGGRLWQSSEWSSLSRGPGDLEVLPALILSFMPRRPVGTSGATPK